MPFRARYAGRCPECPHPSYGGAVVTPLPYGGVVVTLPRRDAAVCDRCNLTKPCECEDD